MPEHEDDSRPSKSELKRQMLALQQLGVDLIELPQRELDRLALPEELCDAIGVAQRIKSREGRRRQLQYIGKLMRQVDHEPIAKLIHERKTGQQHLTREFHALEQMRDDLIERGMPAIDRVLQEYAAADRSRLSQLVRSARKEREREQAPKSARKLFRYLRELAELRRDDPSVEDDD